MWFFSWRNNTGRVTSNFRNCVLPPSRISLCILSIIYYTLVANVNVDAVVGPDAVDGLQFRSAFCVQLVIGPSVNDGTLQLGSLEGSACDRNDRALAVLGVILCFLFSCQTLGTDLPGWCR